MKKVFLFLIILLSVSSCKLQIAVKSTEKFSENKTLTYEECINTYKNFATHKNAQLLEMGKTDVGKPLHVFLLSSESDINQGNLKEGKVNILINNAIHPGEPCGVDASVMFVKTLLEHKNLDEILSKVNIGIIPMYNIGGGLNRGCCSRANQNGPEFYGFRGNARNLDLNRDFIKCDSENAKSFTQIYQFMQPHVFLDTHTSNGADYQHVMTLITTQPDKSTPVIRSYLKNTMIDDLYAKMDSVGYPMVPYVHTVKQTPDDGIKDYLETPRYSTGYAALYNALAFVSEAHMLKSYSDRVQSTYELILTLINHSVENDELIKVNKEKADQYVQALRTFEIEWEMDTTRYDMVKFLGYAAKFKKSEFSDNQRLYYDQSEPWEKEINYYNRYLASERVKAPEYYIVPQAWKEVIERLKLNQVELTQLKSDTTLDVEYYYVENLETRETPYEGHYLHSNVKLKTFKTSELFRKGDYMVQVNQFSNRYIVETLEPGAVDGFFAWNFFDEILQQKEWFSTYVFEDKAADMLKNNEELRKEFELKQASDESFNSNQWAQLYWLYLRSDNYERTHNRYPIARFSPG